MAKGAIATAGAFVREYKGERDGASLALTTTVLRTQLELLIARDAIEGFSSGVPMTPDRFDSRWWLASCDEQYDIFGEAPAAPSSPIPFR